MSVSACLYGIVSNRRVLGHGAEAFLGCGQGRFYGRGQEQKSGFKVGQAFLGRGKRGSRARPGVVLGQSQMQKGGSRVWVGGSGAGPDGF